MYRFIQKYKKKLLAVFAVGLMIVFILPTTLQSGSAGERVLAYIGDEELLASEIQQAAQEWQLLSELRAGPQSRFSGPLPFTFRLGWNETSELELLQGRPPVPVQAITTDPRLFLLLQKEARRMGVAVSEDQLQEVLINELPPAQNRETQELLTHAVRSFMLVQNAFERAASVVKVSEPVRKHALAQQMQTLDLRLVEFAGTEFAGAVPPPTTQQAAEHFKRYADTPREAINEETNPFGFGYRFPNRVKFQYVAIPRAEVRKAIEASREPYQWEVELQKYYQQNLKQFPVTQPATQPATAAADALTLGATRPAATTAPTTRPFAEVREEIKNRIIAPEVDRRVAEIQSRITTAMNADYQAYSKATAASTQPATAPASSLGPQYASFEYLQKLAEVIQRDHKVLPTVTSLQDEFRGETELRALPNIGQAQLGDGPRLPEYLTTRAEVYVSDEQRGDPDVLSRLEPSQPLRDDLDNVYIVRITDAEPAHAPKDMSAVADAVRDDYIAAQSFAQAKEAASKLLAAAEQSGDFGAAAKAAGRNLVNAGPVQNRAQSEIPNFPLTSPANEQFIRESFELLSRAATQPAGKNAMTLIELPQAGKVVVVELTDVDPTYTEDTLALEQSRVRQGIASELRRMFELQWFTPENIRQRLAYRTNDDAPPAPAAPAQPRPPMF
jgi:hypothetical protein